MPDTTKNKRESKGMFIKLKNRETIDILAWIIILCVSINELGTMKTAYH